MTVDAEPEFVLLRCPAASGDSTNRLLGASLVGFSVYEESGTIAAHVLFKGRKHSARVEMVALFDADADIATRTAAIDAVLDVEAVFELAKALVVEWGNEACFDNAATVLRHHAQAPCVFAREDSLLDFVEYWACFCIDAVGLNLA